MRTFYIPLLLVLFSFSSTGQVILFHDSLTAGGGKWTLGASGLAWTVNGEYSCSENTPNNGGGNYMHIYDQLFEDDCNVAGYAGIGSGTGGSFIYSTMKNSVSTVSQTVVSVSFDWLCAGQTGSIPPPTYGTVDYSINGGGAWTNITQPRSRYSGQPSWTTTTITSVQVPSLLNQPDLKIRFGFMSSGYGSNPAFGIDNIIISGDVATAASAVSASRSKDIQISPNPVNDLLFLKNLPQDATITITNILGAQMPFEVVRTQKEAQAINSGSLQPGIYIIRLVSKEGIIARRFVKK